jgi:hypothetical protein
MKTLETRADELLQWLHMQPLALGSTDDAVVLEDADPPRVRVVRDKKVARFARRVGGDDFARALADVERAPGQLLVLVLVDGHIDVVLVGLRPMARGGEA